MGGRRTAGRHHQKVTVMARIFNIYFRHFGLTHNAIVSVRTTPFFTEYILNNISEELMELLPGNKIVSSAPDHFVFQGAGAGHSAVLMDAIIRAVSEHLEDIKIS